MEMRIILWSGLGAVALFVTIGGAWILSLPAGAGCRGRAADREGRGRRHDRGLEAAETPAPADRDHRHQ